MSRDENTSGPGPQRDEDIFFLVRLDAMGLLSDDEIALLEDRLAKASPSLLKSLRDEQSRTVNALIAQLPHVTQPAGLRGRVFSTLRRAIGSVSRLNLAGTTAETDDPREEIFREVAAANANEDRLKIRNARSVNRYWRAAAIGLGFASIAMGYGLFQIQQESTRLAAAQRNDALLEMMLDQYGHTFQSALFGPNTKVAQFVPVSDADTGKAVLLVDPVRGTAQFYCADLPEFPYELIVIDRNGQPTGTNVRFTPTGNIHSENIAGLNDLDTQNRIELLRVDGPNRTAVLRGAPLIRADQL